MNSKIFLVVAFVIALFAFTAFAGNRDTSYDPGASIITSLDPVVQPLIYSTNVQPDVSFERASMELITYNAWVKERVGVMPLDIFRRPFPTVLTCKGYSNVLLKPKIVIVEGEDERALTSFDGLGGNHYARADV